MMSKRDIIKEELLEISPAIASISRNNVYSVPLNYFDGLAGNIVRAINDNIAGSIPPSSTVPFSVPVGYFDSLSTQILGKIRKQNVELNEFQEELAGVAPLLNTISKKMVYQVPDNYFSTFIINPPGIYSTPAKIRSISGVKKVFIYAVAAAVTGILAVGTYFFTSGKNDFGNAPVTSSINIPAAMDKLSEAEIVDYLNTNSYGLDVSASGNMEEDINIEDYIKNMSDEEIRKYLNDNEEPQKKKAKDS